MRVKVGDWIVREGEAKSLEVGKAYEVRWVQGSEVKVKGCGKIFMLKYFSAPIQGKPHKHRDLIIAWANGAEIELYAELKDEWLPTYNNRPNWCGDYEYRIKPQKSAKALEIERIEEAMKELAADLKKARES